MVSFVSYFIVIDQTPFTRYNLALALFKPLPCQKLGQNHFLKLFKGVKRNLVTLD